MLEIITQGNLHLDYHASNKTEGLEMLGENFKKQGYVTQYCIAFLMEKEKNNVYFLGNGIVLPQLPPYAKSIITKISIEIFQFPDGVS